MCLILTVKQCVPHIAEKDIVCDKTVYKFMQRDFIAGPYTNYIYLNVKYHVSITLTVKIKPVDISHWSRKKFGIYEGIHAWVYRADRFRPKPKPGLCIAKAIIPKGTVYYTDGYEIVAEKMIIYNPFTIPN